MDDERWEPGMPVLDRQAVPEPNLRVRTATGELPASLQGLPPRSVPETAPTPLQRHYINLGPQPFPFPCLPRSRMTYELGVAL